MEIFLQLATLAHKYMAIFVKIDGHFKRASDR